MIHAIAIGAIVCAIGFLTLLPFLPGSYDMLAVPLSIMSQLFGKASLVLVPVGALWLALGYSTRFARRQYPFALAALIALTLVWAIVLLGALSFGGFALGAAIVAVGVYVLMRLRAGLRASTASPRPPPAAIYLTIVPILTVVVQSALVPRGVEYSRSRAIRNSAQMIADIEQYRRDRGRYPASLMALWPDYSPSVIGIERFHYEPAGDAYNLFFEQLAVDLATREIVMYNPLDEQEMTSHTMDLLQEPLDRLNRMRGYYAVHDAAHPHWKYFWFD
jgi:hypothetical protein